MTLACCWNKLEDALKESVTNFVFTYGGQYLFQSSKDVRVGIFTEATTGMVVGFKMMRNEKAFYGHKTGEDL